jgi:hypothetical protein
LLRAAAEAAMGTLDYVDGEETLPRERTRFARWDASAFDTDRHGVFGDTPRYAGSTFTATPPPIPPTRWQALAAEVRTRVARARSSHMQIRVADFWLCMIAAAALGAISLIGTLELFG